MKITPISSAVNPLLKRIRSLHQRAAREKSGLFLVEGAKVVNEALSKGLRIKDVLVSQSFLKAGLGASHTADIPAICVVDDKQFRELSPSGTSCGIIATAEIRQWSPESLFRATPTLVLIAHAIQDPGNLGTMLRTALAARASGMILTKGTVDPYNPKVVRSAAGALFALPLVYDITIEQAIQMVRDRGLSVITCDPEAKRPFWELDMLGPAALVFGNEGQGFAGNVLELSDASVSIPMEKECESLNVAVSAAIIMFEVARQRFFAR